MVRHELALAQAQLMHVSHGSVVTLSLELPQTAMSALVARLNEAGMGRLAWIEPHAMDN
jgi:hypothetical protein